MDGSCGWGKGRSVSLDDANLAGSMQRILENPFLQGKFGDRQFSSLATGSAVETPAE